MSQLIRENEPKMIFLVRCPKPLCWSRYCGPSNFTNVESLRVLKFSILGSDCVTNICGCVTNKSNMLVNTGTGTWHWQRRCEACTSVSNRFPSCLGAHPTHFHAFCDPDITIIVTNKYNIMSQKIQSLYDTQNR